MYSLDLVKCMPCHWSLVSVSSLAQIYMENGSAKGDAKLSYEDSSAAPAAVEWFHGKDYKGKVRCILLSRRLAFGCMRVVDRL